MTRTGRPRSFDEHAVVDRARATFWQHGYASTSMRVLADELEVLPGSLHVAFGSKRALFLRSLQDFAEMSSSAAGSLAASEEPLEAVRGLLGSVLEAAREAPGRGCMLGNTAIELLPGDEEARRIVHSGLRGFEHGIEAALRAAQAAGSVRENVDCRTQTRLLVALIQGLHVTARAETAPEALSDVVDTAIAAIETPVREE